MESPPAPTGYFVRLNDQDGYRERLLEFFGSLDYPQVVCLRHNGDRNDPHSHYHFTVATTVKPQAFRVRLKTAFPEGKGNGHMSIKPWDGSHDANSYMFHEQEEHVVCIKGYGENYLSFIRAQSERIKKEVEKAKDKAAWKLVDLTVEALKEHADPHEREIGRTMLRLAFERGKHIPTKFQFRSYLLEVQWRLTHGDLVKQTQLVEHLLNTYLE